MPANTVRPGFRLGRVLHFPWNPREVNNADELPRTISGLSKAVAADPSLARRAVEAQFNHVRRHGARFACFVHVEPPPSPRRTTRAGPLSGVALAHKDVFATGARAPSNGRPAPLDGCDAAPSEALLRLERAGAVSLGALAMAELACGPTGANPHYPRPVNPLDSRAVVGGSSSGSAVAVAAGLCYASLGTDTAGSVRIPAATCGLVGLKPTYGRVPRVGVQPLAPSLDTVGILARSARDAAIVMRVVADPPPRGSGVNGAGPRRGRGDRWRVRCCVPMERVAPTVRLAIEKFLSAIAGFADVGYGSMADAMRSANRLSATILHAEAAHTLGPVARRDLASLAATTQSVVLPGFAIFAVHYQHALEQRRVFRDELIKGPLHDADIVLLPALADEVPDWDEVERGSPSFSPDRYQSLYEWMAYANLTGVPAVVFPIHFSDRGRPVSVQAIARPYADHDLLRFAHRAERLIFGDEGVVSPATRVGLRDGPRGANAMKSTIRNGKQC